MEDTHPLSVEVGEKAMRVLVTLSISAKYSIFLMRYLKLGTSRLTDYLRWIYFILNEYSLSSLLICMS